MHVIRRKGWEIAENLATPEALFLDRRAALAKAFREAQKQRAKRQTGAQ